MTGRGRAVPGSLPGGSPLRPHFRVRKSHSLGRDCRLRPGRPAPTLRGDGTIVGGTGRNGSCRSEWHGATRDHTRYGLPGPKASDCAAPARPAMRPARNDLGEEQEEELDSWRHNRKPFIGTDRYGRSFATSSTPASSRRPTSPRSTPGSLPGARTRWTCARCGSTMAGRSPARRTSIVKGSRFIASPRRCPTSTTTKRWSASITPRSRG